MLKPPPAFIAGLWNSIAEPSRERLRCAIDKVVEAKSRGGRIVAVTGSGPNVHEGVTTLIAGMIRKGLVDGVITSSAVVAHEMAGTLDRVKRIRVGAADPPPIGRNLLPRGGVFEITLLSEAQRASLEGEFTDGWELYDRLLRREGDVVIKAAGNMAWPMGLRTERLAREVLEAATRSGLPFETLAGFGTDLMTMIGAGAARGVPVLVSVPQLVGGGAVGIAIADSIPVARRCRMIADVLGSAAVIIESAIALSQEIHDGPFETYTGHGIWAGWEGSRTYSLEGKTIIRIDLDPNLERAWNAQRASAEVQNAVDRGLPKTKQTGIPFRMEMSGFARLEGSIPVTADIGVAWPILAQACEERLGTPLDFISAPQESEEGRRMREWIVEEVAWLDRDRMLERAMHGEVAQQPAAAR